MHFFISLPKMIKQKIFNLEINELPPRILKDYILLRPNSILSKLKKANKLKIITTIAKDIEKEKLYPSQTWASFNTGLPFNIHKCYWYSDPLSSEDLFWNKLVKNNISVGILGTLHSSKYPKNLNQNQNYKFYLPDSFTDKIITKPNYYRNFCLLNSKLVSASARVTSPLNLLKMIIKNVKKMIINPKQFGISKFSVKEILKIIYWAIKSRNKEFLRMAQFPLYCSIYLDQISNNDVSYSSIFTNHLAGNMHRYWYAYSSTDFKSKNRYQKKWIQRNNQSFFYAMDLIDDFIKEIIKLDSLERNNIILTSSMGQEANSKFDNYKLAKFDAKITNFDLFLKNFELYKKQNNIKFDNQLKILRNMAPQYGIEVVSEDNNEVLELVSYLSDFIKSIDLKSKIDINNFNITLTIDIAANNEFQKKYTINQAKNKYYKYGFTFSKIEDHHSGSHSAKGTFAILGSNKSLENIIKNNLDDQDELDYLNIGKIIMESLKQ